MRGPTGAGLLIECSLKLWTGGTGKAFGFSGL